MKIKSRHHLKGSESKKIMNAIGPLMEDPSRLTGASLEIAETETEFDLIFVKDKPLLMSFEGEPFFTVRGALLLSPNKKLVVVDSGAVKFVVNGADVMSPGIVEADLKIEPGDMVVIVEERHRKPFAIGRALVSGAEMKGERGKAVTSIHYVGDEVWNMGEI